MGNLMLVSLSAIAGAIGTILVGFVGSALFQIWNERRATKVVSTFGFYFDCFPKGLHKLFFDVDSAIPDELWSSVPAEQKHLIENMRVYVFFLESTGSGQINNLKIMAHANDGSGIVTHKFIVEKQVICNRLTTENDEDRSMTATWAYLNPGDFIELYLLATGTDGLAEITIDVDGEGVAIRESFPGNPVNLVNPFKYPFVSPENDHMLLKYVQTWMIAASRGGHEQLEAMMEARAKKPVEND